MQERSEVVQLAVFDVLVGEDRSVEHCDSAKSVETYSPISDECGHTTGPVDGTRSRSGGDADVGDGLADPLGLTEPEMPSGR